MNRTICEEDIESLITENFQPVYSLDNGQFEVGLV